MASYNRVVLVGNLTRDPEYRQLASGQGVCKLGLATNRQFKNRQTGNLIQEVCYVDIDVWGAQAESCNQYLQKGRAVLVEGRLKQDTWEDQNGQTRSKHLIVADRVVFLSSVAEAEAGAETAAAANGGVRNGEQKVAGAVRDVRPEPQNEVEKELFDQIDQLKNKKAAEKAAENQPAQAADAAPRKPQTGEIDFKDQPPFEDELPF